MNESENKGTVAGSVFGVIVIFVVLVVLLYKYGGSNDNVTATDPNQLSKEEFYNQLGSEEGDNGIYNKYIKKIYEAQNGGSSTEAVDGIVDSYQAELLAKVTIPNNYITLQNVSDKFDKKIYAQNFEILFNDLKKNGGTTENEIIVSQIAGSSTLLALSDYDKESLVRISDEYELFAQKLSRVPTPSVNQKKVEELGKASLNVSYILRKMVDEPDRQVYSLWISKYLESMSAIITLRYALQQ